jgi:hypothetical protein
MGVHGETGFVAGFAIASPGFVEDGMVRALINCHSPKGPLLSSCGLSGAWPVSGRFDVVVVPEKEIGDFALPLEAVCAKYRIQLELSHDDDPLPVAVTQALRFVPERIENEFCLHAGEISTLPEHPPDYVRRLAMHAFRYWPGKGFVERICSPPLWEAFIQQQPLRTFVHGALEDFTRDLVTLTHAQAWMNLNRSLGLWQNAWDCGRSSRRDV